MPEDNKPTYEGFIEFVESQSPARAIDHCNWCRCAVGDYINTFKAGIFMPGPGRFANAEIKPANKKLYIELDKNFFESGAAQTYGELNEFINQL